jgi:hypothetical protein
MVSPGGVTMEIEIANAADGPKISEVYRKHWGSNR